MTLSWWPLFSRAFSLSGRHATPHLPETRHTPQKCFIKMNFLLFVVSCLILSLFAKVGGGYQEEGGRVGSGGSEVVDDPADGLDVGTLRPPVAGAAVVATLQQVHAAAEVGLLVHHPAVGEGGGGGGQSTPDDLRWNWSTLDYITTSW